jgi:poly-gamma-glutamate synthesis protein (capsule biosynthesis protein)
LSELADDVSAAREQSDFVVLSMHWGISSSEVVVDYQREIARVAVGAGADLVMGHHPHVIQPIELCGGRPVFYSLGNFAFDWEKMRGRRREGLVLQVDTDADPPRIGLIPVQRNDANLVHPLAPASPLWRSIASDLVERSAGPVREKLSVHEDRICMTL